MMKRALLCLLCLATWNMGQLGCAGAADAAKPVAAAPAPTVRYSGHISGPDGTPQDIHAYWGLGRFSIASAWKEIHVDEAGNFAFDAPPSAANLGIVAVARGLAISGLHPKTNENLTLNMTRARDLEGVLRDPQGRPVAGATIAAGYINSIDPTGEDAMSHLYVVPPPLAAQFTVVTGADGKWKLTGLPENSFIDVVLNDPHYIYARAQIGPHGGTAGPYGTVLKAVRAGSLTGRVLDAAGTPVAGTLVTLVRPVGKGSSDVAGAAATDSQGRYRFDSLAAGSYSVLITGQFGLAPGAQPAGGESAGVALPVENVSVKAGESTDTGEMTLLAPAILKGIVLDSRTGKPLPRASVSAWSGSNPRQSTPSALAMTGIDGRFTIYAAPGPIALFAFQTVWAKSGMQRELSEEVHFDLKAGDTREATLQVKAVTTSVSGMLVDEAGAAVGGVSISLGPLDGARMVLESGADGRFQSDSVLLGDAVPQLWERTQTLEIVSPKKVTLPLPDGQMLRIVLRRRKAVRVEGRVVTTEGAPVSGVSVQYRITFKSEHSDKTWTSREATTGDDGRFSMLTEKTSTEVKMLRAEKPGFRTVRGGDAALKEGSYAANDIVLEPLNRTIKGLVRDAAGAAVAGAGVRSSADGFEAEVKADAGGAFSLPNQPASPVTLFAGAGSRWARGAEKDGLITLREAKAFAVDVDLAEKLFNESVEAGVDRQSLTRCALSLAPLDAETAFALLVHAQAAPDARKQSARSDDSLRLDVIGAVARRLARVPATDALPDSLAASLAWARVTLPMLQDEGDATRAAALLGLAVAARDKAAAQNFLKFGIAHSTAAGSRDRAWLAGLAARLNAPEADRLLTEAIKPADNDGDRGFTVALREIFKRGTPDSDLTLGVLEPTQVLNAEYTAIQEGAPFAPDGARAALARMKGVMDSLAAQSGAAAAATTSLWTSSYARSAIRVISVLGPNDGARARALADGVDDKWNGVAARARTTMFGSVAERAGQAQAAFDFDSRGPWMRLSTASRLGAMLATVDADAAHTLFNEGLRLRRELQRDESDEGLGASEWSIYLAASDPATARITLETEWDEQRDGANAGTDSVADWKRTSIAIAMAAVDTERALEMARSLDAKPLKQNPSARARALSRIGQILLLPATEQWRFSLSEESGFDTD